MNQTNQKHLTVVVIGASGDLARKKIFPALFSLYCQKLLPGRFSVVGFSRKEMSGEMFRNAIAEHLTCRYTPGKECQDLMGQFLDRCHYVSGQYDSADSFLELYAHIRSFENDAVANRMYYMAIPPFLFMDVAKSIGDTGLVDCGENMPGWSRVVIEKPFGRDRSSSDALVEGMNQVFTEEQTYRIDHYLGKELVQNLLVLRFANRILEPIWNSSHVHSVEIKWKENIGIGERVGYFDEYGIVRDVVQNHLLQLLALVAMEMPEQLDAKRIRDEKVRVLRSIPPVSMDDIVLGQYDKGILNGKEHLAYTSENGVPQNSLTPTFASVGLSVQNSRWEGVPFFIKAGKGLDERVTEITIKFKAIERNIFASTMPVVPANELVIRIQPEEGIAIKIVNKVPGLEMNLAETDLDLQYESSFESIIPDAYELLLNDVTQEDKSLFIRADELAAAWDVFTPVLHEMEAGTLKPHLYAFGSNGPRDSGRPEFSM